MLVLSRKTRETVVIRVLPSATVQEILVTVLEVRSKNGTVRLGVTAPNDVMVNREEIQKRIDKEATK